MDDKHAVAVGVVFGAGSLAMGWVLPQVAPTIPLVSSWCIFAMGGILILLSVLAIIRPHWFHKARAVARPILSAALAVDLVDRPANKVDCHLEVKNIGELTVENLRMSASNANFSGHETKSAYPRRVSPNDSLAIMLQPFIFVPGNAYHRLDVTVNYTTTNDSRIYRSSFHFLFPDSRLQTGAQIRPEGAGLQEGAPDADESKHDLLAQLREQTGTAMFELAEVHDGNPNVVRFSANDRGFVFDPVARLVSFTMKTTRGKAVALALTVCRTPHQRHAVSIVWDESKGAQLWIDGVVARDGL